LKKLIKYIPKEDQLCPDGIMKCLTNSTCCPNQNSNPLTYSCCPYPNVILLFNFINKMKIFNFRVFVVDQMDQFVVQIIMIVMKINYHVNYVIHLLKDKSYYPMNIINVDLRMFTVHLIKHVVILMEHQMNNLLVVLIIMFVFIYFSFYYFFFFLGSMLF